MPALPAGQPLPLPTSLSAPVLFIPKPLRRITTKLAIAHRRHNLPEGPPHFDDLMRSVRAYLLADLRPQVLQHLKLNRIWVDVDEYLKEAPGVLPFPSGSGGLACPALRSTVALPGLTYASEEVAPLRSRKLTAAISLPILV